MFLNTIGITKSFYFHFTLVRLNQLVLITFRILLENNIVFFFLIIYFLLIFVVCVSYNFRIHSQHVLIIEVILKVKMI